MTEALGYLASALVVLSLTMSSVVRLRIISLVGSIAFVAYGILIGATPIIITNAAIAVINVWFLRAELGGHRDLDAVEIGVDSPFLVDFVQFHLADIQRFQPTFALPSGPDVLALLLLRDGLPAGFVIGRKEGDELHVEADYVTKPYRDSRLGSWLYGAGGGVFRRYGIASVVSRPGNDVHRSYLERIGFSPDGDCYRKAVGG